MMVAATLSPSTPSTPSSPSESSASVEASASWLDTSVRQHIVELALAGAHQGMATEVRAILHALTSLVPDSEARECLHVALLIALGDIDAARSRLACAPASGQGNAAAAKVLMHWLHTAQASRAQGEPVVPVGAVSSSSSFPISPL